ncbi:MAG: hypothetical protein IJ391_01525 [Clostridia bacterium]|nr:hypothetical protein [Clostridia bacterium]
MFGKLLKYDMKYIFRYWWIVALTMLAFSVMGGIGYSGIIGESQEPLVQLFAILGFLLFYFGIFAFLIYYTIMLYVRYYKHFFTDEGYLTFTLPVKRSTLLNVKLANGMIWSVLSTLMIAVAIVIFIMITFSSDPDLFSSSMYYSDPGSYDISVAAVIIYALEILLWLVLYLFFGHTLSYMAITIGSVVAKKHKVLTSIAIMYLTNVVMSLINSVTMIGGVFWITNVLNIMPETSELEISIITGLFLLLICVITAVACAIVYLITLHLLERRLNLE